MIIGQFCPHRPLRQFEAGSVFQVHLDVERSLLSVEHDGSITWDELQEIKNLYFGLDTCAIEIYPPQDRVVNNIAMRHLWLLGAADWWPDLGHEGDLQPDTLRSRFEAAVRAA